MLTEQVVYQNGAVSADLTVSAASGIAEFRRARMRLAAGQHVNTDDINTYILRIWAYPDMASTCAGTITLDGEAVILTRDHPLTFDTYLKMSRTSETLVNQIEDAIYRLNPGWMLRVPEQAQDDLKKAATISTDA